MDQTEKPIIIEHQNILNVLRKVESDENPVFKENIKTSGKRKQSPSPYIPNKTILNDNFGIFEHPNDQPIQCKYKHCCAYLYESDMIDNLYCTNECKTTDTKQDTEQSKDLSESVVVKLSEHTNVPKITIINENQIFEEFKNPFGKRKQPSMPFQPKKVIITNSGNSFETFNEPNSKPSNSVNINNDCTNSEMLYQCAPIVGPILCKNKNCGAYLFKHELFDNSYCTLECKKSDLEQSKKCVINLKDISHIQTKSLITDSFIEKPFGKRKQSFGQCHPNKICLTKSWVEDQQLNVLYSKPSVDVNMKDGIFDEFNSPQNDSTRISSRCNSVLMDHSYYNIKHDELKSEKTKDLEESITELENHIASVVNNDNFKKLENIEQLFPQSYTEKCDELEQLENSCRRLTIDEKTK